MLPIMCGNCELWYDYMRVGSIYREKRAFYVHICITYYITKCDEDHEIENGNKSIRSYLGLGLHYYYILVL